MLSTKHTGVLVDTGKNHFQTKQSIINPNIIVNYNQNMGGVDNLSKVIVPYCIHRKGVKWYRKIAELFLEIAKYNSYIVWRNINNSNATQLSYRQNLVKEILILFQQAAKSTRSWGDSKCINKLHIRRAKSEDWQISSD